MEFKLYPVGRGDSLRVQGCDMSVYDGLGDKVIGDSKLEQVSANCGLLAQPSPLPLSVKLYWNPASFICSSITAFIITVVELNTTEMLVAELLACHFSVLHPQFINLRAL